MPLPHRQVRTDPFLQQAGSEQLRATFGETMRAMVSDPLLRPTELLADYQSERELRQQFDPAPDLSTALEMGILEETPARAGAPVERLSQAQVDAEYEGLGIRVDDLTPRPVVDMIAKRRREDMTRQDILARGPQGLATKAAQFGVALLGSAVDPLNVASAFIPIVGQTRYAAWIARVGRTPARTGAGAVEGVAGALAIEPVVYGLSQQLQLDYDMNDALLNVALGGFLGAGLHVAAGAIGDRLARYAPAGNSLDLLRGRERVQNAATIDARPETIEAALKTSVAQTATGRDIEVKTLFDVDREINPREQVRNAAIRIEGRVFEGRTHADAIEAARKELGIEIDNVRGTPEDLGGFITTAGRFVDRDEALAIADARDQILPGRQADRLLAEDLRPPVAEAHQEFIDRARSDFEREKTRSHAIDSTAAAIRENIGEGQAKAYEGEIDRLLQGSISARLSRKPVTRDQYRRAFEQNADAIETMARGAEPHDQKRLREAGDEAAARAPAEWTISEAEKLDQELSEQLLADRVIGEAPVAAPAAIPARTPFAEFPDVVVQRPAGSSKRLTKHADYKAAKAGDVEAAVRLVAEAVDDAAVARVRAMIGDRKPTLVPVISEEATGRNKLPLAYAEDLSARLELDVSTDIVQANRPQRTGKDALYRLTHRVEFDGPVVAGREYFLVDDMVTQGGTLADLRGYIEARGGRVVGATTLMGAQFSDQLAVRPQTLADLRERLPVLETQWKQRYGYGFESLTESEARELLRFRSAHKVRAGQAAEGREGQPEADVATARAPDEGREPVERIAPQRPANVPAEVPDQLFRGSGREDKASVYNQAGAGVPILGRAGYFAFERAEAEFFGPNIETASLAEVVENPLVITDGRQWHALTKEAEWPTPNPFGRDRDLLLADIERLRTIIAERGHDGVIVWWDDAIQFDAGPRGENLKLLRNVFYKPQAISFRPRREIAETADAPFDVRTGVVRRNDIPELLYKSEWEQIKEGQPFDTIDRGMAMAAEKQPQLIEALNSVKEELPGIKIKNPGPKKDRVRIEQKVAARAGNVRAMTDLIRAGVEVETPAQADTIAEMLGRQFQVLDEGWMQNNGYFDRKLMVRFADGQIAEVQVWPKAIIEAKSRGGHAIYEELRALGNVPPSDPRYVEISNRMEAFWAEARARLAPEWQAIYEDVLAGVEGGGPTRRRSSLQDSRAPASDSSRPLASTSAVLDGIQPESPSANEPAGVIAASTPSRLNQRVAPDIAAPVGDTPNIRTADDPGKAAQAFDPVSHIQTVAKDLDSLRAADLERLFETAPRSAWPELRNHIVESRPSLVLDAMDAWETVSLRQGVPPDFGIPKRPPLVGREVPGIPQHRVTVGDGMALEVQPIVMEASDVVTSSDSGYNQVLQPRNRDRAASDAQIRNIAANLDPERMGYSTEADRGSPIIGPDGMVESGNGRVMAIRLAYERGGEQIERYKEFLAAKGVDLADYKQPILVRQRLTDLSLKDRREFAVAANQDTKLALSAPERAVIDGRRIEGEMLALIRKPEDLGAIANRDFVRAFVAELPVGERGMMTDAQGGLSAEGLVRVRNAVLARAYGDVNVLTRIAEATSDDVKSISNALVAAAPEWAMLRADVESGAVRADVDLTAALVEAVGRTADLRAKGMKLDAFLAQQDAFDRLAAPVEAFMRMFYDPAGRRAAGAAKIIDGLRFYAEEARKVSAEAGLDLGLAPVRPADLQRLAIERSRGNDGTRDQAGLFDDGGTGDGPGGGTPGREASGRGFAEGRREFEGPGERSIEPGQDPARSDELIDNLNPEEAELLREADALVQDAEDMAPAIRTASACLSRNA